MTFLETFLSFPDTTSNDLDLAVQKWSEKYAESRQLEMEEQTLKVEKLVPSTVRYGTVPADRMLVPIPQHHLLASRQSDTLRAQKQNPGCAVYLISSFRVSRSADLSVAVRIVKEILTLARCAPFLDATEVR